MEFKAILTSPSFMTRPVRHKEPQLYLGVFEEAISAVLLQENPDPKVIYT